MKFKPDVFEWCSCKDYESKRSEKCKHLFAIEFAIRMGTLKDIDKLPAEAKRYGTTIAATIPGQVLQRRRLFILGGKRYESIS